MRTVTDTPPPSAFASYTAGMDKLATHTEQLCTLQPGQDRVRTALLDAEQRIHHGFDWGEAPPLLFFLRRQDTTSEVKFEPLSLLSRWFVETPAPPSAVLERLADVCEWVRQQAQLPEDQTDRPYLDSLSPDATECFDQIRQQPDADLFSFDIEPGWTFQGLGLISETWFAPVPRDPDAAAVFRDMARKGMLHQRSDSVLTRQTDYVARDGWVWKISRFCHTGDIDIPTYCVARTHDTNSPLISGTVPNALSRLCNALASNQVPTLPQAQPPSSSSSSSSS